jgi:hypothetical protein
VPRYCRNIQAPHITQDHVVYCRPLKIVEFQYCQGGSKVIRSLDSLMGQALSYGSSEGPRLVSSSTDSFLQFGFINQSMKFELI